MIALVQLPNRLESVPTARLCATSALQAWGVPEATLDDVALLLTEVSANAVRHGRGTLRIEVEVVDEHLVVRAIDDSDAPPRLVDAELDDEGGRGLWLVEAIAEDWGWEARSPAGKAVWFHLSVPPAAFRP